jgi:hypothetical protein
MLRYPQLVREVRKRIREATDQTILEIGEHDEQEPVITASLVRGIRESLSGMHRNGVRVTAQVLSDRGRNSQERRSGADLLGVLDVQLPSFSLSKGFLAQAKKLQNGLIVGREAIRTRDQCRRMLRFSPDSFLFAYSADGLWAVPASSIVASNSSNIDIFGLYYRTLPSFYEIHLTSFVGDPRLGMKPGEKMREVADRVTRREPTVLYVSLRSIQ